MSEPLDHHGPLEGMCFLGLNFTHKQFSSIAREIAERMDPQSEHGVEGAIVSAFAENARLRGVIESTADAIDAGMFLNKPDLLRGLVATRDRLRAALSPQPGDDA